MKKKISLIICMLVAMLCFTGCSGSQTELKYDESTIEQSTEYLLSYCQSADDDTIEQWKEMDDFSLNYQLMQSGLPYTADGFLGALESWQSGLKECGAYVSHGNYKFETSKDELKVTTEAKFKDRDATLTFVYNERLKLESMTVDGKYSMGEVLEKAGLNTVLGMGTVFVVLIFISLIISLFKFIPALENAWKNKGKKTSKEAEAVVVENVASSAPAEAEDVTDDTELVAVIAAAIAAYEGTSTDGFVVRSIKRRPSNKWNA
ncbi:MAG: OadG family transporter subunit [Lachnospiraceae bacterium]|nr:OadG family transporter subunit [Lachnospiraceae bacterium]